MSVLSSPKPNQPLNDDPEAVALTERWNEAIEKCQSDLRHHELADIRDFQGPQQLDADLRKRLEDFAQGRLKDMVPQISPFFEVLQQMVLKLTNVMPKRLQLSLVSGGAYLTVKNCSEFEEAAKRIIDNLDRIKKQLILFQKYSETLKQENCRQGLVQMFIAMIKFWVASVRFLSRNSRDKDGDRVMADRWPMLHQKFLLSLQEIEEAVKFVQQLQDAESNSWSGRVAKAQSEIVQLLPDIDVAEASFPCYEIADLDANFLGRSKQLDRIDEIVRKEKHSKVQTIVISGFAGVGKSTLALAAAHRIASANPRKGEKQYDAIFWLNAENEDVLRESFTNMALRLLLRGATERSDKDRNFMLAKNWLDKTQKSWLLIYDNVDRYSLFDQYRPPSTGTVFITTRFQSVSYGVQGQAERIHLEKFSPEESLQLFNRIRQFRHTRAEIGSEQNEIKELLELIDGLALGIKQMASYIGSKRMKVSEFQEKYCKLAKFMLDRKTPSSAHTLDTLWSVQFKAIKERNASKLLGLLSLCDSGNISRELFQAGDLIKTGDMSWIDFCASLAEVEEAIEDLDEQALVDSAGGDRLSVHRLTQEAFLYNEYGLLENTRLQAAFDGLVFLLDHRFPGYGREKSLLDQWDICARYLPHVSALTRVFKKFLNSDSPSGRIRSSEAFVGLLTKASWYLQEIGDLRACSNLLQIACDACEDKTSLIYAYLCNTHVVVAVDENDMSKAQKYSTKAIAIRENRLASDDLDLAISYNNYGIALLNEGRYDESLANLMLSDSIWADTGLDDETYKALTYLNTGRVYSLKGDVDLAIPYFKKAEITFSRISNNVFLIGVHYTWATLLMNQQDLLGALGKFRLAYSLANESMPDKMITSAILYKLAVLKMKLGLPMKDTREHLQRAMVIAEFHRREAEIARIGRQWAIAIGKDSKATEEERQDAEEKATAAKEIKERLWRDIVKHIQKGERSEEEEYDWLVAAWYR